MQLGVYQGYEFAWPQEKTRPQALRWRWRSTSTATRGLHSGHANNKAKEFAPAGPDVRYPVVGQRVLRHVREPPRKGGGKTWTASSATR